MKSKGSLYHKNKYVWFENAFLAPDAIMRLILRKPSYERTTDDLEMIYDELLHIKALGNCIIIRIL